MTTQRKLKTACVLVMVLFTSLFMIYFTSTSTRRYTYVKCGSDQSLCKNRLGIKGHNAKLILFSSYKRSGSTFLGALMGWHHGSYYWYEPLLSRYEFKFMYPDDVICDYQRPDCKLQSHHLYQQELQDIFHMIEDVYNCNFSKGYDWIKDRLALHSSKIRVGPSWDEYHNCKHPDKSRCMRRLVPVCMNSSYRVIKLLRMDLRLSNQLLVKLPTLKMIHLFRDPRGQLNSHLHTNWYYLNENDVKLVEDDVIALCDRMRKDIQTAKRLLKEFPDRFRIVQYEDFDNPVDKTRRLYEFLGMAFDDKANTLVESLMPTNGSVGFHPFSYRDSLQWQSVKLVNEHCYDLYKELGVTIFKTERDLRNHSVPAILGRLPYSLE